MVNELPHVDWIKEETFPPGHAITAELKLCGPKLKGIMGGVAGRYLMDEYERGACGNMPACEMTDVHSAVWNLLDSGDRQEEGGRERSSTGSSRSSTTRRSSPASTRRS